jgi:uncharacterized cupredoxin-like copper-binding protein
MSGKTLFIPGLLLMLALYGCGGLSQPATEHTIQETDFAYSPVTIRVPINQPITLIFKNTGAVEHDFVIEKIDLTGVSENEPVGHAAGGHDMGATEYDLHVSTLPGKSSSIQFTPTEAGTFEFFCTVKGHKEAGMIGRMIVVSQ